MKDGRKVLVAVMAGAALLPALALATPTDITADGVVLVGEGQAIVHRFGRSVECEGPNVMVVEGSTKPFGLEPVLTIHYAGGRSLDASMMFPCFYGHRIQPPQRTIQGDWNGPFMAETTFDGHVWHFEASGSKEDGTRDVLFVVSSSNGDFDSFQGSLTEIG